MQLLTVLHKNNSEYVRKTPKETFSTEFNYMRLLI